MVKRSYTSAPREQVPRVFDVDGVEFTCTGQLSKLDVSEFARLAAAGTDSVTPAGVAILADIFRSLLGSDYERFRTHCREHGTDDGTLLEIIGDLISEMAERPTSRPSDSSDGPPTAPATVTVVSFSKATVEEKPAEETPPVVSYG